MKKSSAKPSLFSTYSSLLTQIKTRIRQAQTHAVFIKNCEHMPHIEKRDEFFEIVKGFFSMLKLSSTSALVLRHLGLWVEFTFAKIQTENTAQETTQKTTQKILDFIRQNPAITRQELAEKTGLTSDGIKYHLKRMQKNGWLRRIGPDRGRHWEG